MKRLTFKQNVAIYNRAIKLQKEIEALSNYFVKKTELEFDEYGETTNQVYIALNSAIGCLEEVKEQLNFN